MPVVLALSKVHVLCQVSWALGSCFCVTRHSDAPLGWEASWLTEGEWHWEAKSGSRRTIHPVTGRCAGYRKQPQLPIQVRAEVTKQMLPLRATLFPCLLAVWNRIIEPVAAMRKEADMLRLFPEYLKGEELFGLTVHAVLRIAESVRRDRGWGPSGH